MIKIEVTGSSIVEVADKLLAIGSNLKGSAIIEGARAAVSAMQAVNPVMPEVAEAADKGVALFSAPQPTAEVEVAEQAPVDPTPAPKSAPAVETTESQPTTQEPSSTRAPAPSASETLNFETDVAPLVLQVVKEKGKPVAVEILSQFGVEKASLLDPAQWPELVELLKGAL